MNLFFAIMWAAVSLFCTGCFIFMIPDKAGKLFIAYAAAMLCFAVFAFVFFFPSMTFYGIYGRFFGALPLLIFAVFLCLGMFKKRS